MKFIYKFAILVLSFTPLSSYAKTVKFVVECVVSNPEKDSPNFVIGRKYVSVNGNDITFNQRLEYSDTVGSLAGYADSTVFVSGKNRLHFSASIVAGARSVDRRVFRVYMEKFSSGQNHLVEVIKLTINPGEKGVSGSTTIDIDSSDLDPELRREVLDRERLEDEREQKSALEELADCAEKMFEELQVFREEKQRAIDSLLCFPAGTKVHTGFSGQAKSIEDVCQGDLVCSYDVPKQTYCYSQVAKTYVNPGLELVRVDLDSGESIVSTSTHLFYDVNEKSWIEAQNLGQDSILLGFDGLGVGVVDIQILDSESVEDVYSITAAGTENFFVGEQGVLVHNCTPGAAEKIERAIVIGLLIYPGTGAITRLTKIALRLVRMLGEDSPIVQSAKQVAKQAKESANKYGFKNSDQAKNVAELSSKAKIDNLDTFLSTTAKHSDGSAIVFRADEAVTHFAKHAKEMKDAFGKTSYNLKEYMLDAHHVVKNGQYVSEMNGYVRLIGGKGSAKAAFVGMTKDGKSLTTMHLKSVSELKKRAPGLGWN